MPSKYLEDPDRLVRYVPWGKLIKDDDEKVIGVIGAAFALRSGEEYLSATWCEYFDGSSDQTLRCAVGAIRNSELKPSPKGHFAVAEVKAIRDFMATRRRRLRIIHERANDNPAHAAVRGWPEADDDCLDRLAELIWNELYAAGDIDKLAASACSVSTRGAE